MSLKIYSIENEELHGPYKQEYAEVFRMLQKQMQNFLQGPKKLATFNFEKYVQTNFILL